MEYQFGRWTGTWLANPPGLNRADEREAAHPQHVRTPVWLRRRPSLWADGVRGKRFCVGAGFGRPQPIRKLAGGSRVA